MDEISFSLVYEHCSRGNLSDVIKYSSVMLDWDFRIHLIRDLVNGMIYLHKSTVKVHGMLTSRNCVINSRWLLKITNFGVNKVCALYNHFKPPSPEELLWTAPELLRDPIALSTGTQMGDVYSFAIIMQELILRSDPYPNCGLNAAEIIERVRVGAPIYRPNMFGAEAPLGLLRILRNAWIENPVMRPSFQEIEKLLEQSIKGRNVNIVDHIRRIMEKYSAELEAQVEDRKRELQEEKQRTEMLIANMLPLRVAQRLIAGNPVPPEAFDEVTIYFSDIVGFSHITAKSTGIQIAEFLNDLYSTFDLEIRKFDVYKVETIGDSYVVASGLPTRNGRRHAGEIASMALELLSISGIFVIRHLPTVPLLLRIGIHTGPCVAGVIGLIRPRYCLFGDTMNTASRMQSTGEG
uniref:guanylate cyclase n=4 Tax=Schistocephalus solidus TaxID=70667 RepID=A0A0X3P4C8_SCHSO